MYIWLPRIFCKWSYFKSFPERSEKKKKQNENEKNFLNNLALTSCLSDTIWFSSQFFQHFFSTLYLSIISNLISFFSFFFFFSFHLTIAQISPDSVEFFHVISYRLWNSNYFFFGNPVPLKITKAYIRLILKFVNGIIFRVFRFSRITKIRSFVSNNSCRSAELMETFNKKTSEIRGEESGIKVWKKGHGERGSDVAMLMDTDRVTCAYILERNFSRAERVSSAKI